jgi:hypothetical protein
MNKETAASVNRKLRDCYRILEDSILEVNKSCRDDEAKKYRQTVGAIFSTIVFDLMEPLYQEHPELKPEDWKD